MTELVDKIKERLESSGFNCEFDDTIWIKDFQQVVQGGTLIVNGQPIQQESSYRNITMIFEICYECDIKDADTGNVDKSLMCGFQVIVDGEHTQHLEINLYKDDYDFFNRLITQIFGI